MVEVGQGPPTGVEGVASSFILCPRGPFVTLQKVDKSPTTGRKSFTSFCDLQCHVTCTQFGTRPPIQDQLYNSTIRRVD